MHVLIVYESIYGNTRQVAESIAAGIGPDAAIDVMPVSEAPADLAPYDMVLAGGPTHMHGMTSTLSREMAVKGAKDDGHETEPGADARPGLRDWLRDADGAGISAAAFDTRADKSPHVTGMAARGIAKRLRRAGFDVVDEPQSYLVGDAEGPLVGGEIERARYWGAALTARAPSRS